MTTFKKTGGWEITPKTGTNDVGEEHHSGKPSESILTVTVPDPPPADDTGGGSGTSPGGTPGPGGGGGGAGGGGTLDEWLKQLKEWQKYLKEKKAPESSAAAKKKAEDAKRKRAEAERAKQDAKDAKDAADEGTGSKDTADKKAAEAEKKERDAKQAEKELRKASGGDPEAPGTTHALTITVVACDTAKSIAAKMKQAAKDAGLVVDEKETGGCTVADATDVDAIRGPGVVISFHGGLHPFKVPSGPAPGGGAQDDDDNDDEEEDDSQKMIGPGGNGDGYRNLVEHDEIDWTYRIDVEGGTPEDGVGDATIHVALLAPDLDPRSIRVIRANRRLVRGEGDRGVLDVLATRLRLQGIVALRTETGLLLSGDVAGNVIVGVTLRLWPIPGSHAATAHWRLVLPQRVARVHELVKRPTMVVPEVTPNGRRVFEREPSRPPGAITGATIEPIAQVLPLGNQVVETSTSPAAMSSAEPAVPMFIEQPPKQ